MTKARIIPSILTNGSTVVKGSHFNNWRTVGNVEATARLFASRNVDELMFLDVQARKYKTHISPRLIETFSGILDIPFSIGGGISDVSEAQICLRSGAEKVIIGTAALESPDLISEIALKFGSQAVVVALDMQTDVFGFLMGNSGQTKSSIKAQELIVKLESFGAGEMLLQSVSRDGTMSGYDLKALAIARKLTALPIIISGGCASNEDALHAIQQGANAVAVGALFQFTETTPQSMTNYLKENGVRTRIR